MGTDVDRRALSAASERLPGGSFAYCDFLNSRSRAQCCPLKHCSPDLVLLNPPFSYRGGTRWRVSVGDASYSCTRATAFVAIALSYLSPTATLVTLLPAGCLTGQADAEFWQSVRELYRLAVVAEYTAGRFPRCHARTVIIRISARPRGRHTAPRAQPSRKRRLAHYSPALTVRVIRGVVPVSAADAATGSLSLPFIHTTALRRNSVVLDGIRTADSRRGFCGPAVLLPRVSQPSPEKICLLSSVDRVVLSDCVIALTCRTREHARELHRRILCNWRVFAGIYGGTCAPYTTLRALVPTLARLNVRSEVIGEQANRQLDGS